VPMPLRTASLLSSRQPLQKLTPDGAGEGRRE